MGVVIHGYISARERRSRVKGRSAKRVAVERALAHVKYIQHRQGEDREPDGRKFFTESEENLDGRSLRKAIKELEESNVVIHKLTLAPEVSPHDKRAFTREVMQKLSEEKGQNLRWMAVEHNNTAHHHIHVVILGKDKQGKNVRLDKTDYPKLREWGDRYLERVQPFEMERAREERNRKEKERIEAHKREKELQRQERIREGLELPWMHKKIIREQYEPYSKWKQEQEDKQKERNAEKGREGKVEKPYFNDTIFAVGKEWSRQNTAAELRELNSYLWDNPDERIPRGEYKKLISWIKDHEQQRVPERSDKLKGSEPANRNRKDDSFEYQGKRYSKDSSYEQLTGLASKLRDKGSDRVPIEQYQNLRAWIENADRARWARVTERQLEISKQRYAQEGAARTSPGAHRAQNPLQQQMMSNPVVGLFMQGASLANELVRWVDLRDNRDRLKEAKDGLEDAKKDKHQDYVKSDRTHEQRERDQAAIEEIDKAIDENEESRKQRRKDKENEREKRDRGLDYMR